MLSFAERNTYKSEVNNVEKIMEDRELQVMKIATQTSNEARQNNKIMSASTIDICVYLKEDTEATQTKKIVSFTRVPAMGEFIELDSSLYRVFLVCHQPNKAGYEASISALKTTWDDYDSLIISQEHKH